MNRMLCLWVCLALLFLVKEKAMSQSQDTTEAVSLFYFVQAQAHYEQNIDSSIYYLEKGLHYYKEQKSWTHYINCYNGLSSCHYHLGNFEKSLNYAKKAMKETRQLIGKNNSAYTSALNNLAHFIFEKRDYDQALDYLLEALAIEQEIGQPKEIITLLNNIGLYAYNKGDFAESLRYYKEALKTSVEHFGATNPRVAIIYIKMAQTYQQQNQLDTALAMHHKAIAILSQSPIGRGKILIKKQVHSHLGLAEIFLKQEKTDSILYHINRANSLSEKHLGKKSRGAIYFLGDWYRKQGQYPKAEKEFQKALKLLQEDFQIYEKHISIGLAYQSLASCAYDAGSFQENLLYSQQALQHVSEDFQPTQNSQNPELSSLIIEKSVLDIVYGKAKCQYAIYQKKPGDNPQYLDDAIATYQLAIQIIGQLRKSFLARGSKENLAALVIPIYEGAINCIIEKNQSQPSPKLLEDAFYLAESSKAILLLESINESVAKGAAGIPDSLLKKDQRLRTDISFYERKKVEVKKKGPNNADKLAAIEQRLFDLEQAQQHLLKRFEKEYPNYYQLKFNTHIISIADLQNGILEKNSLLLEYFVGEEHLYLFQINQQNAQIKKIKKPADLESEVELFRSLLVNPPGHEHIEKDFQNFSRLGHHLFQLLIEPATIPASITQLTIVPDDILGYIPFEVLLSQAAHPEQVNFSPQSLHYLLNDFQITYTYSATLLAQNQEHRSRPKAPNNFIGFAPKFSGNNAVVDNFRNCDQEELSDLQCSQQEIELLHQLLGGKVVTGTAARKKVFQQEAADYRIVHLATHSCLDDQNPMLNKIFLTDDYLANYDLFNLNLRADLAVLSACNTGSGTLLRGEGIMSLSRGFFHAGCPSTLISLWSVEDCTTSDIMKGYYEQLKTGATKDEALRQSKLHYLQGADRLQSHPFYWAPFVQFGDTFPVALHSGFGFWVYAAGLAILLLGIFVFFQKNRTQVS